MKRILWRGRETTIDELAFAIESLVPPGQSALVPKTIRLGDLQRSLINAHLRAPLPTREQGGGHG